MVYPVRYYFQQYAAFGGSSGATCIESGRIRRLTAQKGDRTLNNKPNPINRKTSSERDLRRTDASGERVGNLILLRISDKEYNLIRSHLEFIDIREYQSLHEPGEPLKYIYFPNSGMVSIVIEISDGRTLEVGVVTKKGFAGGLSGVDQGTYPYRLICQPPVDGFRIRVEALQQMLPAAPGLRSRLSRYANFQCLRVSQIAACNRFHEIEQRLARWLLMSQDRVGSSSLPFTHEFLAACSGQGVRALALQPGFCKGLGLSSTSAGR